MKKDRVRSMPAAAIAAAAAAAVLSGCASAPKPVVPVAAAPVAPAWVAPPRAVVSVFIDAPMQQPAPIVIATAPPPMLVDVPPPSPFVGATWVGGFWAWQGDWVWAAGRWGGPPRKRYSWVQPYYELRDGVVVFVAGYWSPPNTPFVAPPRTLALTPVAAPLGAAAGAKPVGPAGVFVPPPPGSRPGVIVPAPVGTAPAVVIGAPPVIEAGLRVEPVKAPKSTTVRLIAPASATAMGRAYEGTAPMQASLAAAVPPWVRAAAPKPASSKLIAGYDAARPVAALPPSQMVYSVVTVAQGPTLQAPTSVAAAAVPAVSAASTPARPVAPVVAAVAPGVVTREASPGASAFAASAPVAAPTPTPMPTATTVASPVQAPTPAPAPLPVPVPAVAVVSPTPTPIAAAPVEPPPAPTPPPTASSSDAAAVRTSAYAAPPTLRDAPTSFRPPMPYAAPRQPSPYAAGYSLRDAAYARAPMDALSSQSPLSVHDDARARSDEQRASAAARVTYDRPALDQAARSKSDKDRSDADAPPAQGDSGK